MDDDTKDLQDKVKELSDLELAALICLIADEHCLVATDDDTTDDLERELRLIAAETFGLTCQVIECSAQTTLDEFGDGVLLNGHEELPSFNASVERSEEKPREPGVISGLGGSRRNGPLSPSSVSNKDEVAEVIIAKNLDQANHQVQIQALELLRGKRIFSRTGFYTAPKKFLFIALLSASGASNLVGHLNDHFFISHYHSAEDGFPNLEDYAALEMQNGQDFRQPLGPSQRFASTNYGSEKYRAESLFTRDDIDIFAKQSGKVKLSAEVRTYLHNIIVFMRLHRAVAGGISSQATRHFHQLVQTLAPLHGIDFVTPSLVALATRKIYPHRIVLVRPEKERSLQWGSSLEAVREALDGITVDDVLDDVLEEVEVPV